MKQFDDITDSMDMSLSTPGDSEGQGSLVCCSPWGRKELDMTQRLNNNKGGNGSMNLQRLNEYDPNA